MVTPASRSLRIVPGPESKRSRVLSVSIKTEQALLFKEGTQVPEPSMVIFMISLREAQHGSHVDESSGDILFESGHLLWLLSPSNGTLFDVAADPLTTGAWSLVCGLPVCLAHRPRGLLPVTVRIRFDLTQKGYPLTALGWTCI